MVLQTSGNLTMTQVNTEFFQNDNPVNTYNWYNYLTPFVFSGGFTPIQSGSDPNVQIQLTGTGTAPVKCSLANRYTSLHNANQFVCTFQMQVTTANDMVGIFFGATDVFGTGGTTIAFQNWSSNGVYLLTNAPSFYEPYYSGNNASSSNVSWYNNGWVNVMITYQKGTIGTWNVYINGVNVISYNDPTNAGWLNSAGTNWGFYGFGMTSYFRQVNLSTNLPFSIVSPYNYYTNMQIYNLFGGYTVVQSGTDPYVQYQLCNNTNYGNNQQENMIVNNFPVQNYSSFSLTFQYFFNGSANYFNVYFGMQSNIGRVLHVNGSETNAYKMYFSVFNGGTNLTLVNGTGTTLASGTASYTANSWQIVSINYNRNAVDTWRIMIDGVNRLTYSDTSNQYWVNNIAGKYWGINASSNIMNFYIRMINMVVTPYSGGNSQKLVTPLDWYSKMTIVNNTSGYTAVKSGSDPLVQYQLSPTNIANSGNNIYMNNPIQQNSSFTLQFQFMAQPPANGTAYDSIWAFIGESSGSNYLSSANSINISIALSTYTVYIDPGTSMNSGTLASGSPNPVNLNYNAWYTCTIIYNKSTTNTWRVEINGYTVCTYSNASISSWVSNAGNYWGIGAHAGGGVDNGNAGGFFVRNVQLSINNWAASNTTITNSTINMSQLIGKTPGINYSTILPSSMTSNTLTISGNSNTILNGTYTASASSSFTAPYDAFKAIPVVAVDGWTSSTASYNTSTNLYTGATSTTISGTSYLGEWVQLQVPNAIVINSFIIYPQQTATYYTRSPSIFVVGGSNDGSTWTLIHTVNNNVSWNSSGQTFTCNLGNNNSYIYFRIVVQAIYTGNDGYCSIAFLNYYTNSGANISFSQLMGKSAISSGLNSVNTLATDQGAYNSNTSYISSFTTDTSARMIQIYGQAINLNNKTNSRHLIQQTYTNTTTVVINATMTMSCHDFCKVYQNKVLIYPNIQVDASNFTFQIILQKGLNLFEFVCWKNNDGLGGFIYTLINNSGSAVLMRSDNNSVTPLINTSKITLTSSPGQLAPLNFISNTYNCSGAYSLVLLKANGSQNVCNVRRSSDNATSDVRADWQGNLIIPGETSLANWLNGATAYVVTWYDQSGTGNNATQSTAINQPTLTWNTTNNAWCVDATNATNSQYMLIPSNTLPVSVANAPYSVVFKIGTFPTGTSSVISSGALSGNQSNSIRGASDAPGGFYNYWFGNDFLVGTNAQRTSGSSWSIVYDGNNQNGYVNNVLTQTNSGRTGATTTAGQQYLFIATNVAGASNPQLHYMYVFKTALSTPYNTGSGSNNNILDNSAITVLNNTLSYQLPLPNPCLNQQCPLDVISSTTKSACRGAFALIRLSLIYTGATVNLRRGLDNATSDFYADIQGNLGTSINGTGTTLANWLQGTIGYVKTWYDQSGSGNNATQTTDGLQPVISPFSRYQNDDVNYLVDSQNSSTQFLNLPNNTIPSNVLNAQYSFVLRHQAVNNSNGGAFLGAGSAGTNNSNLLLYAGGGYDSAWYSNDVVFGTFSNGNNFCTTFDGSTRRGYINTTATNTLAATGYTATTGSQYLFKDPLGNYLNGQMYYCYIFGTAIPDVDRLMLMTI